MILIGDDGKKWEVAEYKPRPPKQGEYYLNDFGNHVTYAYLYEYSEPKLIVRPIEEPKEEKPMPEQAHEIEITDKRTGKRYVHAPAPGFSVAFDESLLLEGIGLKVKGPTACITLQLTELAPPAWEVALREQGYKVVSYSTVYEIGDIAVVYQSNGVWGTFTISNQQVGLIGPVMERITPPAKPTLEEEIRDVVGDIRTPPISKLTLIEKILSRHGGGE